MRIAPALLFCTLALPALADEISNSDPVLMACPDLRTVANNFQSLDGDWPARDGRQVRAVLNDIEDTAARWDAACRANPIEQGVMNQLPKWQRRAKAAAARDRAVKAMVRGKNASAGDDGNAEVAKEYFTLAIEAWDEAFAALADFKGATIRIDDYKGQSKSAGDWRALAQQRLSEL